MDYSVLSLGKALTSCNSVPCGNYTILLVGKLVERTNFTQQQRAKMHIIVVTQLSETCGTHIVGAIAREFLKLCHQQNHEPVDIDFVYICMVKYSRQPA